MIRKEERPSSVSRVLKEALLMMPPASATGPLPVTVPVKPTDRKDEGRGWIDVRDRTRIVDRSAVRQDPLVQEATGVAERPALHLDAARSLRACGDEAVVAPN